MTNQASDLVQGTLEMLVLKTLALEPMHGYGIALRIEQVSDGVFCVNPGSLLPALSRMERAGHVKTEWRTSENNRRGPRWLSVVGILGVLLMVAALGESGATPSFCRLAAWIASTSDKLPVDAAGSGWLAGDTDGTACAGATGLMGACCGR